MDKIQEEFECWLKSGGNLTIKESDGEYSFQHTRFAFEAWKASRAALRVKLPSFDNGSLRGYGGDCEEARAVVDSVAESLEKAGVRYE